MDRFQSILDKKCDDLLSKIHKSNKPKDINKKKRLLNLQEQLKHVNKVYQLNALKSEVKSILKVLGINAKEDIYTNINELKKQINSIIEQGLDSFKESQSTEEQKILKIKQEIKKGDDLKNIKKLQEDLEKIEKAIHYATPDFIEQLEEELNKKSDDIELLPGVATAFVTDLTLLDSMENTKISDSLSNNTTIVQIGL